MPDVTPVTTPVEPTTVAMEILLLLHVPPGVPSAREMVEPGQTWLGPVMDAGVMLTVIGIVMKQPVGIV